MKCGLFFRATGVATNPNYLFVLIHTQIVKSRRTSCHSDYYRVYYQQLYDLIHEIIPLFVLIKSTKSLKNVTDVHNLGHAIGPIVKTSVIV